jgi:hypothetical protein
MLKWRKSSHSGANQEACVELAALPAPSPSAWRKASYSGANSEDCVELAALPAVVAVRDSKHPEAGHLALSRTQFAELTARIKSGDLTP